MIKTKKNPNLEILEYAVARLGILADSMVFLGGCAAGLLISDPAAPPVRVTRDVDAIVQVGTRSDYYRLTQKLRDCGFKEDASEGAPVCRWLAERVILDVMPTDTSILGFGNDWYQAAMDHAETVQLPSGKKIQMVTSPYFLMTKIEAFSGRGVGDYQLSHDIEDIIAVIDGRPELLNEIGLADRDLKHELARCFKGFLESPGFIESLPGHLPPDVASQGRVSMIIKALNEIVEIV